jgi:hypothetical protein
MFESPAKVLLRIIPAVRSVKNYVDLFFVCNGGAGRFSYAALYKFMNLRETNICWELWISTSITVQKL